MTTHRRYAFHHPQARSEGHEVALQVLERACEQSWWYQDPEVSGQPFGHFAFAFTVSGRDQWWTHHRALRLATDVYYALGMTERDMPAPEWEPLAPHTNRGYSRSRSP